MKEFLNEKIVVGNFTVLLAASLLSAIGFTLAFLWVENSKLEILFGGFSGAFSVAFLQLITMYSQTKRLSRFERMGVVDVLAERKDQAFYGEKIGRATAEILVLGVTCSRLLQDFSNPNNHSLADALNRRVRIRLLIPSSEFLTENDKNRVANDTVTRFQDLNNAHGDLIALKYMNHPPTHSLFSVDDECIVGPIFYGFKKESRYTPSIILDGSSALSKEYKEHFDNEWDMATENFDD